MKILKKEKKVRGRTNDPDPPPGQHFSNCMGVLVLLLLALRFSQSCKLQRDFVKAANCSEYLSWLISSLD
jgi:hypothetical protein